MSPEEQYTFVNALREAIGKEPIPYSQKNRDHYSGMPIYGMSSGRVTGPGTSHGYESIK
jgi:hypothetical protein